jgi:hypothetical protein
VRASLSRRRGERSQALVEFAVVSPVLLLLTFGIVDFARALYFYVTIDAAARDLARYASQAAGDSTVSGVTAWTAAAKDDDVLSLARVRLPGLAVTTPPCINGPLSDTSPPIGAAYVYVTNVNPGTTALHPPPEPNAPGGELPATPPACSDVVPASGNSRLQVTIVYNYAPVTPLVGNVIGNHLLLQAGSVARAES